MLPFDDAHSFNVSYLDRVYKMQAKKLCFPSYKDTGKILQKNLPKVELIALKGLPKKEDLIIQKADKCNTVVI